MTRENTATMDSWMEHAINGGNLQVVDELAHPDYVYRNPNDELHGAEAIKGLFAAYRSAFPDFHVHVDDRVSAGDRMVQAFRSVGRRARSRDLGPNSLRPDEALEARVLANRIPVRVDPQQRLIAYFNVPLTPPGDNDLLGEFVGRVADQDVLAGVRLHAFVGDRGDHHRHARRHPLEDLVLLAGAHPDRRHPDL